MLNAYKIDIEYIYQNKSVFEKNIIISKYLGLTKINFWYLINSTWIIRNIFLIKKKTCFEGIWKTKKTKKRKWLFIWFIWRYSFFNDVNFCAFFVQKYLFCAKLVICAFFESLFGLCAFFVQIKFSQIFQAIINIYIQ